MSSFTVSTEADFILTEEQFSDKSGLLEEVSAKILVNDPASWTTILAQVTPRDLVNVRVSRGLAGAPPTIVIDLGGGAGPGTLVLDDYPALISGTALLVEVTSEAPIGTPGAAVRAAHASWLLTPLLG